MNEWALKGGQLHITENRMAYQVKEGTALVFLFPYADEKPGRRQFLLEVGEGESIPGFAIDDKVYGSWRIGICALDHLTLQEIGPAAEERLLSFANQIGIFPSSIEEYDEYVTEKYNMNLVKEEGYLFAAHEEQQETYEKGLKLIYHLFEKKKRAVKRAESGDALYDATALLCDRIGISIASYEKVKESSGRKFTIHDIARVSHFVTREVILEENWFLKDAGPMLAFEKKNRHPVALVPMARKRYLAYFAGEEKPVIVDENVAEQLDPKAVTLCRPFPNKPLKAMDLVKFGLRHVSGSDIARVLILALIGTLIGLLLPWLNEKLYDEFIPMGDRSGLLGICGVVLACTIGNVSFTIVKNLSTFRGTSSMKYAVQTATYDRLFNLPESVLTQYDSAELASRSMGITSIFSTLTDVFVRSALSAVFSLLYLWRMFKYSKKLSGMALVLLLLVMAYIVWVGIRQTRLERQKLDEDLKAQSRIHQLIAGISKIRIAGVENRALYEYLVPYTESRKINIRKERMTVRVNALAGCASVVFSMVFYYLMVRKNLDLSVGAFMAFTSAFGSFSSAMLEITTSFLQANDTKPLYEKCKPILETTAEFDDDAALPGDLKGEIEVNHVTFAYNEESGNVINQLSLHVKPGEYVGIVGSSGSGKSTLLKLLLGFEKPQIGRIYYDGRDIDSVDKRELRKKMGVVLQDGGLIPGSIQENITITAPNTKIDRVNEVIEEVGLKDDVNAMPMGIHTVLAENSGTISGGQKQRVLIARAIVGKPKILFFDEATSALDNVTQAMVCESLEKLNATRIVIAHRLSTVINCDRILVMEHGEIVEEGNYTELMAAKGRFYDLAIRQIS